MSKVIKWIFSLKKTFKMFNLMWGHHFIKVIKIYLSLTKSIFFIIIKNVFTGFVQKLIIRKGEKNIHVWMSPHEIWYIYKAISSARGGSLAVAEITWWKKKKKLLPKQFFNKEKSNNLKKKWKKSSNLSSKINEKNSQVTCTPENIYKKNHATSLKLYWSHYLQQLRDSLSPVCGIFSASRNKNVCVPPFTLKEKKKMLLYWCYYLHLSTD